MMGSSFRQSMAWLHTWTGLVTGWVLFFIFATGTLGYFYVEIDRWMKPELPVASAPPPLMQATARADAYLRKAAPDADFWMVRLPTGRQDNLLEIAWGKGSFYGRDRQQRVYDPKTDEFVSVKPARETGGGYQLYRMHWKLHYFSQQTGVMLVGLCTMMTLVALLAGIVTHKKIFSDFFTFRPRKGQRSWLDMHNLLSVAALPFFVMITFSGLVFYMESYVPAALAKFQDKQEYWEELEPQRETEPSGQPGAMLPLTHFQAAAAQYWQDGAADVITVQHPGDAHAEVMLVHAGNGTVLRNVIERLHFDANNGQLLEQETAGISGPREVRSALLGLHEGIFAGWVLRWLYFLSGLAGCGMIATGLILWTVKRRAKQAGEGSFGFRLVECLNIGTLAGLPVGIAAYFWANRLLPAYMPGRAAWEMHCLFLGWGMMLLWASVRPAGKAWTEVLTVGAAAFGLLPLINLFTTDRHLGVSLVAGDWGLATFDLLAFATAACLAIAATWVRRKEKGQAGLASSNFATWRRI